MEACLEAMLSGLKSPSLGHRFSFSHSWETILGLKIKSQTEPNGHIMSNTKWFLEVNCSDIEAQKFWARRMKENFPKSQNTWKGSCFELELQHLGVKIGKAYFPIVWIASRVEVGLSTLLLREKTQIMLEHFFLLFLLLLRKLYFPVSVVIHILWGLPAEPIRSSIKMGRGNPVPWILWWAAPSRAKRAYATAEQLVVEASCLIVWNTEGFALSYALYSPKNNQSQSDLRIGKHEN